MHIGQTYKAQTQVNTQTSTSMEEYTQTQETQVLHDMYLEGTQAKWMRS